MISQTTINQVFETARLEEVIGDFVQLKKAGSNFKGLSPFSDERTPSFMVSPVKQIWKDFSSGKGGNVVAFLMEHEHYSYPEAIKYLAKKYNIEIEETERTDEQKQQASERESMYLVSEYAQQYFSNILHTHEQGKAIGLTYFKERGFTPETIKKFKLGYALNEWEAFTKSALEKGYKLDYLNKTGLTIVKENKQFDRFKGRVLFPIHSMSGRVLGFGGRILTNDKKAAKYLNSPESEIYHKSKVLYGLYQAKKAIAKEDNCFLVEGYTDVIQLHQAGIENVVSSSGTALTPGQIRLINRLTNNITVLFDGDAAGLRASLRGVDLILEQGMNVRVCSFPEGEDPDSFAKRTPYEELVLYLEENAKDFISFKADILTQESASDPIKKAEVVRDMVTSISKIPDTIKQELYIKECSRIMNISEEVLFATLAQLTNTESRNNQKEHRRAQEKQAFNVVHKTHTAVKKVDEQYELERKVIQMLLLYGDIKEEFDEYYLKENDNGDLELEKEVEENTVFKKIYLSLQEDEMAFANSTFQNLYYRIVGNLEQEDSLQIDVFINQLEPDLANEVTTILMNEERYVLHDWERQNIFVKQKDKTIAQLVNENILTLRRYLVTKKIDELAQQISAQESNTEVLQNIIDYTGLKKVLSEKLNRVL
ncbi:DNA primase [Pseudofulvibacter geojedonensis]|uniref:DNA primase n=1 Tax=Pseudofulvibacter geojedonensis TaxID=1123758 RepID=A0ABW3I1Q6_9FLAO